MPEILFLTTRGLCVHQLAKHDQGYVIAKCGAWAPESTAREVMPADKDVRRCKHPACRKVRK